VREGRNEEMREGMGGRMGEERRGVRLHILTMGPKFLVTPLSVALLREVNGGSAFGGNPRNGRQPPRLKPYHRCQVVINS